MSLNVEPTQTVSSTESSRSSKNSNFMKKLALRPKENIVSRLRSLGFSPWLSSEGSVQERKPSVPSSTGRLRSVLRGQPCQRVNVQDVTPLDLTNRTTP